MISRKYYLKSKAQMTIHMATYYVRKKEKKTYIYIRKDKAESNKIINLCMLEKKVWWKRYRKT